MDSSLWVFSDCGAAGCVWPCPRWDAAQGWDHATLSMESDAVRQIEDTSGVELGVRLRLVSYCLAWFGWLAMRCMPLVLDCWRVVALRASLRSRPLAKLCAPRSADRAVCVSLSFSCNSNSLF